MLTFHSLLGKASRVFVHHNITSFDVERADNSSLIHHQSEVSTDRYGIDSLLLIDGRDLIDNAQGSRVFARSRRPQR